MLDSNDPHVAIRTFAKHFFRLAAQGDIQGACETLDEPSIHGVGWTPDLIQAIVEETFRPGFRPGTSFRRVHPEGPIFTDPGQLIEPASFEIVEWNGGRGYSYDYAVPLNGEWSDLTAQFEFYTRPRGLAAVLHDLHVL